MRLQLATQRLQHGLLRALAAAARALARLARRAARAAAAATGFCDNIATFNTSSTIKYFFGGNRNQTQYRTNIENKKEHKVEKLSSQLAAIRKLLLINRSRHLEARSKVTKKSEKIQ